ncbi:MAG: hypothetical protein F6K35_24445 [Okeania sp. SIO2H7]|nr:hypothetical protein [Okeania sp. SIO2H7]
MQGAEIVLQGAEIVLQGAEIVVHQVHNHFCAGFTISTLSPNLQFIGIFILAKVLCEKPGFWVWWEAWYYERKSQQSAIRMVSAWANSSPSSHSQFPIPHSQKSLNSGTHLK